MNYYFVAHSVPMPGDKRVEVCLRAYIALNAILGSYPKWMHYMDGLWVIGTDETMKQVRLRLEKQLPAKGFFLLIWPFHEEDQYEGRMPKEGWEWLNDRETREGKGVENARK